MKSCTLQSVDLQVSEPKQQLYILRYKLVPVTCIVFMFFPHYNYFSIKLNSFAFLCDSNLDSIFDKRRTCDSC